MGQIKPYNKVFNFVWLLMLTMGIFISTSLSTRHEAFAQNRTTCNISAGFKVYYIQKNGKLGKRDYSTGTTNNRTYTCIKDRYYHRIQINGKWRYVSVKAESSASTVAETSTELEDAILEQDAEGIDNVSGDIDAPSGSSHISNLTSQLPLKDNYNIRDSSGNRIASTLGVDAGRQSVQVKLMGPNTPITNSEGLVSVQYHFINSRGRSESVDAWISPEAIINYDEAVSTTRHQSQSSGSSSSNNTASGSASADVATEDDYTIDNQNLPKAGEQIHILNNIEALIPKSRPFLVAEPVEGVKPLNKDSEIIYTGNRKCDRDSKKCFVEVEFSDDTDGEFVGWIDEQQTSINPAYHLLSGRGRVNGTVNGLDSGSDELADANGERVLQNDNWYEERFTEEERESHKRIREFLSSLPPVIKFETNRGLIRMHNDRRGFCGSYHYATESNPRVGASDEIQTYAKPVTGCVIARLAQTWKKYHCPNGGDNNGCRLSTGDISHRTQKKFDGHSSHTNGECVDLRPIRKSGVGPLDFNSSSYDRAKTRELIKLLKDLGGTNILFNDPVLKKEGLSSHARGHHNHIHVCFKQSNRTVKNSCSGYAPDFEVCPELRSFFDAPLMQQFKK